MMENDREYFSRRRQECLSRAATAHDPAIARIHRDFAEHYARVLEPLRNMAAP